MNVICFFKSGNQGEEGRAGLHFSLVVLVSGCVRGKRVQKVLLVMVRS